MSTAIVAVKEASAQLVEQVWIHPVVCGQCKQPIASPTRYFRLAFELDGPDRKGYDVCPTCAKKGKQ